MDINTVYLCNMKLYFSHETKPFISAVQCYCYTIIPPGVSGFSRLYPQRLEYFLLQIEGNLWSFRGFPLSSVTCSADIHLPVESSDQVSDVIREDDTMLAHVPVVSQHTHRHVGGYFGQLPQDVVKSPANDKSYSSVEGCEENQKSNQWVSVQRRTKWCILKNSPYQCIYTVNIL